MFSYISRWSFLILCALLGIVIANQLKFVLHLLSIVVVKVVVPAIGILQYALVALSVFGLGVQIEYPPQAVVHDGQTFDFIIVGAGSAGCVLANRLTEVDNWRVLLIEAGDDPSAVSNSPALSILTLPAQPDWGYYTTNDGYSSQALKTKNIRSFRGKMLGGSSGVNFMYYVRGNKADYDNWAELGNEGWNWDNVTAYFKKSENLTDADILKSDSAHLHGTGGYLSVSRQTRPDFVDKYLKAFEDNGRKLLLDINGKHQIGYTNPLFTIYNATRQSTANAFLKPIRERSNLNVLKKTFARRIVFDGHKAVGVEVKLPGGEIITVKVNNEVILSAGAINSPQLLMLSGIGLKKDIEELSIKVVVNSPNVGKNLQDHAMIPIVIKGEENFHTITENFNVNLGTFPAATMMGFAALDKSQSRPDYQVIAFGAPSFAILSNVMCENAFSLNDRSCIAFAQASFGRETLLAALTLLHPESRGKIKLQSSNPEDRVLIHAGLFADARDIDMFARCIQDYTTVVNTTYFKKENSSIANLDVEQCSQFLFGSHEYWKCYALSMSTIQYHACGTCAMGREGVGVVDERLRVRGVGGLRVVDASVMPTIISGNTNAAVIMIAEKAADMIKQDYGIKL